jgi:hypothetical protein
MKKCTMILSGRHLWVEMYDSIGVIQRKRKKGYPDILWSVPKTKIQCSACGIINDNYRDLITEKNIKVRLMETLSKSFPGRFLIIPVVGGKDIKVDKLEMVNAIYSLIK